MTLGRLAPELWDHAVALVAAAGLPTADLRTGVQTFFAAWEGGPSDPPLGVIAWEPAGTDALVRSFVVGVDHRQRGVGRALYQTLERAARDEGFVRLVLLTETAETFFLRQGFVPTDRESLGPLVRATAEFTDLCPSSAVCLSRNL